MSARSLTAVYRLAARGFSSSVVHLNKEIRTFRTKGLICAPCTIFKDNGDLDLDIIPKYIQHLQEFGVPNAFVTGTNGEGNKLTVDERKQWMERWVKESKGKIVNILQIGAGNLKDTQELARYAQDIGAEAIACVGPTYYKPTTIEAYVEYMRQVAAVAPKLPFYLYDIDFVTGIKFTGSEFMDAAKEQIPTLRGLKHTSPDFISMNNIVRVHGDYYQLLMGTDEIYLQGLAIGIEDTIMSSFLGNVLNRLKAAFDKGDLAAARKEQNYALQVGALRRKYNFSIPSGNKAMLQAMGFPSGQPRCPDTPITPATVDKLKKDLTDIGFFEWATKK